jgi:glycosyltransferase involved in cell wall biosynthesis
LRIGYFMPEFPGQTHIWLWREVTHLREWGLTIRFLSTRPPSDRDRARHAFADGAARETFYLWPRPLGTLLAVLWALVRHPIGLARALGLALRLPVEGARYRTALLLPGAATLALEARRQRLDRVHVISGSRSAILAMMAQCIGGTRYSLVLTGHIDHWGGAMAEKIRGADFVVTHSRWVAEQVRERCPELAPWRIVLAPVGVDTQRWRAREGPPPISGRRRIVCVGRLHRTKGQAVLIDAVSRIVRRGYDGELRLIGTGPEEQRLRDAAGALGIADRVRFLGSLPEDAVFEELRGAEAFALATEQEALGVVFMEAMAAGVPVIGTPVGGVVEVIEDERTGLLVPPQNPEALAAALARLLDDASLGEQLGAAGRAWVVENFDSRLGARTLMSRFLGRPAEKPVPVVKPVPMRVAGVAADAGSQDSVVRSAV